MNPLVIDVKAPIRQGIGTPARQRNLRHHIATTQTDIVLVFRGIEGRNDHGVFAGVHQFVPRIIKIQSQFPIQIIITAQRNTLCCNNTRCIRRYPVNAQCFANRETAPNARLEFGLHPNIETNKVGVPAMVIPRVQVQFFEHAPVSKLHRAHLFRLYGLDIKVFQLVGGGGCSQIVQERIQGNQ